MSLVTHLQTDKGDMDLVKPRYTNEDIAEFQYLLKQKVELDDIEHYLICKACNNMFDPTVKGALTEVRQSKQYVKVRSNYLSSLLTEQRYK